VIGDGGEESWREWLGRHGPALLLLARQHCPNAADAQDAVQDGFVRFWRSRDRADDPTAYAFACVRSAAIDLARGRRRRDRHEPGIASPADFFEPASVSLEQEELWRAVEAALANLPAEQREVLVMKVWGGLTFAQIAAALQINADTAASRYRYALGRLQTTLRQEARHE
jgi:RNA polymerase sigma-70 factor, ECF subfamily